MNIPSRQLDAEAAHLHSTRCRHAGMSLRAIAAAAGTSPSVISSISRGHSDPHPALARAIGDVIPGPTSAASTGTHEPFVPRLGTNRRIQALLAIGWTHADLRNRCGLNTAVLLSQKGRWVRLSTHQTVADLYRQLAAVPGPSQRTRRRAARLGYLSPVAWDDIDRDPEPDTGDQPDNGIIIDDVAIWRRMQGERDIPLTPDESRELVRRWIDTGRSITACERTTGLGRRQLDRGAA